MLSAHALGTLWTLAKDGHDARPEVRGHSRVNFAYVGAAVSDISVRSWCVRTNLLPVVSLTALVITTQGRSATQETLEQAILSRAVASIRNAEPEWQFAAVAVNAGPIMDEQLGVAAGHWYKLGGGVIAWIYRIATEEAAESWVLRLGHGLDVKGMKIQPYGLGDRAIIATYVNPRFTQYVLWIRKGKFLFKLDSVSKEHIEQFAKSLIASISN